MPNIEPAHAAALAQRIAEAINTALPHLIQHSFTSASETVSPEALHPAFHGSYDWHSSVHMHWSLARLLNFGEINPEIARIAPQVLDVLGFRFSGFGLCNSLTMTNPPIILLHAAACFV